MPATCAVRQSEWEDRGMGAATASMACLPCEVEIGSIFWNTSKLLVTKKGLDCVGTRLCMCQVLHLILSPAAC